MSGGIDFTKAANIIHCMPDNARSNNQVYIDEINKSVTKNSEIIHVHCFLCAHN